MNTILSDSNSSETKNISKKISKITVVGMLTNISLSIIKITIGYTASSKALVYDGIHSISDLVTDLAVIIGAPIWTAPADEKHPYGHGRFETIINIFIGLTLLCVGIGLAFKTITDWGLNKTVPGWPAFWAALASIISKEILYRWTIIRAKKINSRALIANAWHHRSDALSSIPVAISVLAINFFPKLPFMDSLAAILVVSMIIKAASEILTPSLKEILEFSLGVDLEKQIILESQHFEQIKNIHKIRSRRIGSAVLIDMHLLFDPETSLIQAHEYSGKFKKHLMENREKNIIFNEIADIIIHIEPDC